MQEKLLDVLPRERLEAMVAHEAGTHRHRIYTPLVTLGLFVEQAISRDQACQDAVGRALSQRTALGLTANSLNTGPYGPTGSVLTFQHFLLSSTHGQTVKT